MRNSIQSCFYSGLITIVLLGAILTAGCNDKKDSPPVSEHTEETTEELATIEGTWAGVMHHTYYCEASPSTIQLDITASTITVSAGTTFAVDTAGSIALQNGQAYSVILNDANGAVQGQFFVDPAIHYAVLAIYDGFGADEGYVGVLQKGSLASVTYQESDLVGSWAGVAVRVDANFGVTVSSASSATITSDAAGLGLSGTDGDGAFAAPAPGIELDAGNEAFGIYVTNSNVTWPENSYDALFALSLDKKVLGVGFLTSLCHPSIFSTLPAQKFAIWIKQ